jgi:hypothetical protein
MLDTIVISRPSRNDRAGMSPTLKPSEKPSRSTTIQPTTLSSDDHQDDQNAPRDYLPHALARPRIGYLALQL